MTPLPLRCSRPSSSSSRAAALGLQPSLCMHTLSLHWLTVNTVLSEFNVMQYITLDKLTLVLQHMVGKKVAMEATAWVMLGLKSTNNRLQSINSHWQAQREYRVTWEIARTIARNATRIDLPKWLRSEHYFRDKIMLYELLSAGRLSKEKKTPICL